MPASCSEMPGPGWAEPELDADASESCCVTRRIPREFGALLLGGMAAMPWAWSSPERSSSLASFMAA